jgi:hypothetical protein
MMRAPAAAVAVRSRAASRPRRSYHFRDQGNSGRSDGEYNAVMQPGRLASTGSSIAAALRWVPGPGGSAIVPPLDFKERAEGVPADRSDSGCRVQVRL